MRGMPLRCERKNKKLRRREKRLGRSRKKTIRNTLNR